MLEQNWLLKTNVGDITPYIKAIEQGRKEDPIGKTSAKGPNSKQVNIFGNYNYQNLIIDFINEINDPHIDKSKFDKFETSLWTVEGQEHSYHELHRHSQAAEEHIRYNNNLSTVLYLNVPSSGGDFYFIVEKEKDNRLYRLTPQVGDLIIFPWSVYHGVYPQGPGLRKSVSLDFEFK